MFTVVPVKRECNNHLANVGVHSLSLTETNISIRIPLVWSVCLQFETYQKTAYQWKSLISLGITTGLE